MRLNTALTSALVSSASLMGYAHAAEDETNPEASVIERPTFTVSLYQFSRVSCSRLVDFIL
jgi:calnexin